MTIAVMVFRMAFVSALAAGVLIAVAGLLSPGGTPQAFAQADTTAPTVWSVAITSDTGDRDIIVWDDDGVYGIGDRIRVTVTFSEDINVTGSPRLELDIGGVSTPAEYESDEGGKVVFGYTVVEGDADDDGIAIGENKLTPNGGSIKDAANNEADLSHEVLAAQNDHRVDGIRPIISDVRLVPSIAMSNGIYVAGETLVAHVDFNEDVLVAGSPQLALDFQGTTRSADHTHMFPYCEPEEGQLLLCGSSIIRGIIIGFGATVLEGDEDNDGVAIAANALSLNGGTIEDAAGNGAVLTHDAVAPNSSFLVDGVAPTISAIAITSDPGDDNSYGVGDQVEVTVTFSENVRVTTGGYRPRLMLDIGGKTKVAKYVVPSSPDPMKFMKFTYTVEDGDNDNNGIAVGANKLQLLGTKVYDTPAGNPANITHQALPDDPEHTVSTPATGSEHEETSNTLKSGLVKITGEARAGATLTADPSGIIDDDGVDHAEFLYLWLSDRLPVGMGLSGEHPSPHYELQTGDAGDAISVRASFYDDAGNSEVRFSAALQIPTAPNNNFATGLITISGTAQVGETLTADTSGIDDDDELTNVAFSYQWLADNADIAGATGATYTLVPADEGKAIKVVVSFTDDRGNEETLPSEPTGEVAPDPGPLTVFTLVDASTDPDTLLETLEDGDTLTLAAPDSDIYGIRVDTDSNHDDHDDIHKVELALSGAKDVSRPEKHSPYSLYGDDGEDNLTGEDLPAGSYDLKATAYDANNDEMGTLKVSFTVAYAAQAEEQQPAQNTLATGAPAIDGIARVGETLTADTSGIHDDDGLTNVAFSYQWLADNADIAGATGATYTLVPADEGKAIKVVVSFTDDRGNEETLPSEPTGEVAPDPGPLTVFTLVDASTDPDTLLETLEDGDTLTLAAPDSDIYGIRVDTDSNHDDHDDIHKVELALSGAKDVSRPEKHSPYSLYGDDGEDNLTGEDLPVGSYSLTATAHRANGDVLGTLKVSFTVEAQEQTAVPNNEPTGAPTISGTAQVGETLTADTSGIDDDDELTNVAFSYQWLADNADIAGATGATYTLVPADEGKAIKVVVSFTDDRGNEETLPSEPTGEVAPDPGPLTVFTLVDASTDPDTLLETLEDGDTLTLAAPDSDIYGIRVDTDSNHDDHDDIHKVELALSGAKDVSRPEKHSPYSLYGDDGEDNLTGEDLPVGSYSLTATAHRANGDVLGTLKVSFTVEAQEQTAVPNNEPTGAPTISGTAQVGETLTADTSGIDDDDELTNVAFSYQWLADNADIAGATGATYTLVPADEGKAIKVVVSFTDDRGNEETLPSEPTGEVAPDPGPLTVFTLVDASTDPDTLLETLEDGDTLTLAAPDSDIYGIRVDTDSNHDDHDDIHKVELALSGAKDVSRPEKHSPYSLYGDDGEDNLTGEDLPAGSYDLKATAYDANNDEMGTLKVSFTVAYAAQAEEQQPAQNTLATGAPAIDGIARVGETLTADTSGIHDDDGLTNVAFTYQWLRNDGNGDTEIQDATSETYTLTEDDEGKTIKVKVSFTDDRGNEESLTSDPTGAVEAAETVPGRPQDLEGEASAQGIELTWAAPDGVAVTQYVLYRGELQNGSMNGRPMTQHATIDAAGKAMTYTDDNVEEGVEYRYRVAAVNSAGEGKKSNWLDITAEEPSP